MKSSGIGSQPRASKARSVRGLLIQAAIWAVAGNVLILCGYLVSGSIEGQARYASERAIEIRTQVDQVVGKVYQLSAAEERLLRLKQPELKSAHQTTFNALTDELAGLTASVAGDAALLIEVKAIESALKTYAGVFERALTQQEVVGVSQDTGLLGALGAASDSVEYRTTNTGDRRLALIHRRVRGAERSYLQSKNPQFLDAFNSAHARLQQSVEQSDLPEAEKSAFIADLQNYAKVMVSLVEEEAELIGAFDELKGIVSTIPPAVENVRTLTSERVIAAHESVSTTRTLASIVLIATVLLVAVVMVLGALWLTRRISEPLRDAVALCQRIASGEVSIEIQSVRQDEIGELMSALAGMTEKIRTVVTDVRDASQEIVTGASEISAANEHLSHRTEQSAASLEETASSMEEMTATVRQTAANASKAAKVAERACGRANEGGTVVLQAIDAMEEINQASHQVEGVIGVVNAIAFQTNLLALNAAVEAARAGEAGRGFAVVASEVRALAQRSAEAVSQVKKLIAESTAKVETGQALVNQTGELLKSILEEIELVTRFAKEIDVATNEQSEGITLVNSAVLEMDQVTQQNAAMVEEAAASARAVEERALELVTKVAYFRLEDGQRLRLEQR